MAAATAEMSYAICLSPDFYKVNAIHVPLQFIANVPMWLPKNNHPGETNRGRRCRNLFPINSFLDGCIPIPVVGRIDKGKDFGNRSIQFYRDLFVDIQFA